MYYDITNSQELINRKAIRIARPNISLPTILTADNLNDIDIAIVTVPDQTEKTDYNTLVSQEVQLIGDTYTMVYTYEDRPLEDVKLERIAQLDFFIRLDPRPEVIVPLEDTSTISIYGGRDDQTDIGERYRLMQEDSIPSIYLKDYDGNMQYLFHLDIKRCYKAITIHRNNRIEYQWAKEADIMAATTPAELDAVTWE